MRLSSLAKSLVCLKKRLISTQKWKEKRKPSMFSLKTVKICPKA
jgi:hypothetical protein